MKKLRKLSMEEQLHNLDKLSSNQAAELNGGISGNYGRVGIGFTGTPTNKLPPFKNQTGTITYTF